MMSESTTTALIVGSFGFLASIITALTSIIVAKRGSERIIERVVELKKNTDGLHSELMNLSSRAASAEGQIKGAEAERERLITEPGQVTEAMNGSDVRDQMDKIEASVLHTQETLAEEPVVRPAIRRQIDKIESAVSEINDADAVKKKREG